MNEIERRALETWYEFNHPLYLDLMPSTLGLVGEAGEFADLVKKINYKPGHNINVDDLADELGDVLYYVAVLAYQIGYDLDAISRRNHQKLQDREKNGNGYNRGMDQV